MSAKPTKELLPEQISDRPQPPAGRIARFQTQVRVRGKTINPQDFIANDRNANGAVYNVRFEVDYARQIVLVIHEEGAQRDVTIVPLSSVLYIQTATEQI